MSKQSQSEVKKMIKNNSSNKNLNKIIKIVKESGGMEYAEKIMNQYKNDAFELLNSFEDSVGKKGLQELVNFTIARKR